MFAIAARRRTSKPTRLASANAVLPMGTRCSSAVLAIGIRISSAVLAIGTHLPSGAIVQRASWEHELLVLRSAPLCLAGAVAALFPAWELANAPSLTSLAIA